MTLWHWFRRRFFPRRSPRTSGWDLTITAKSLGGVPIATFRRPGPPPTHTLTALAAHYAPRVWNDETGTWEIGDPPDMTLAATEDETRKR